jgi:hypothetical protein
MTNLQRRKFGGELGGDSVARNVQREKWEERAWACEFGINEANIIEGMEKPEEKA